MVVVDTCVLIDIAEHDPEFGVASARCLAAHLSETLTVSPISYVELAPVFDGSRRNLDEFLAGLGVEYHAIFDLEDRKAAFSAWHRHISEKRAGRARRRPVADVLIGALAMREGGLITRDGRHFEALFPRLRIIDPTAPDEVG